MKAQQQDVVHLVEVFPINQVNGCQLAQDWLNRETKRIQAQAEKQEQLVMQRQSTFQLSGDRLLVVLLFVLVSEGALRQAALMAGPGGRPTPTQFQ